MALKVYLNSPRRLLAGEGWTANISDGSASITASILRWLENLPSDLNVIAIDECQGASCQSSFVLPCPEGTSHDEELVVSMPWPSKASEWHDQNLW